jgi:hypothetical protein
MAMTMVSSIKLRPNCSGCQSLSQLQRMKRSYRGMKLAIRPGHELEIPQLANDPRARSAGLRHNAERWMVTRFDHPPGLPEAPFPGQEEPSSAESRANPLAALIRRDVEVPQVRGRGRKRQGTGNSGHVRPESIRHPAVSDRAVIPPGYQAHSSSGGVVGEAPGLESRQEVPERWEVTPVRSTDGHP